MSDFDAWVILFNIILTKAFPDPAPDTEHMTLCSPSICPSGINGRVPEARGIMNRSRLSRAETKLDALECKVKEAWWSDVNTCEWTFEVFEVCTNF